MSTVKKFLWPIKRVATKIGGTAIDALAWRTRHLWDHTWPASYIVLSSLNHPHRTLLIETIQKHVPISSILEIGAASGPNCYLLAKRFPETRIEGIDVSKKAVKIGNTWLSQEGIKNVILHVGNATKYLKNLPAKSVDIIITDATLIYVGPREIETVLKEMCRVAKKAIVLVERHHEKKEPRYEDSWIHNYRALLKHIVPNAGIQLTKISSEIWPGAWSQYGFIIDITL